MVLQKSLPISLIAATLLALAWRTAGDSPPATTLIFVRHAEKTSEAERDPDLTDLGRARAVLLEKLLSAAQLDAVYSTDLRRTRATGAPVAAST